MTEFECDGTTACVESGLEVNCSFPTGTSVNAVRFYRPASGPNGFAYKYITESGTGGLILGTTQYVSCPTAAGCNL